MLDFIIKKFVKKLPEISIDTKSLSTDWWKEVVLVDKNSKLIDKQIEVNEIFIIPKNEKEILIPLKLKDKNLNYEIYLLSKELPYSEDIEVKLNLTYNNSKNDIPYELIFEPLNKKYEKIKTKLEKIEDREILIPPINPTKKYSLDEKVNLFEMLAKELKTIIEIANFYENKQTTIFYKENIEFDWFKDKKGFYVAKVEFDDIGLLFFHQRNFDNFDKTISSVSFEIEPSIKEGYRAFNITEGKNISTKKIKNFSRNYKIPLNIIWSGNNSLSDKDIPIEFKEIAEEAIKSALLIYKKTKNEELKKEMLYFLSCLNSDTPQEVIEILKDNLNDTKFLKKYKHIIVCAIKDINLEWQKELFDEIINLLNSTVEQKYSNSLKILGMVFSKNNELLLQMSNETMLLIAQKLYQILEKRRKKKGQIYFFSKNLKMNIVKISIINRFKLLLLILKFRNKNRNFLSLNNELTYKYIKLIDSIAEMIIRNDVKIKIEINSEIENVNYPNNLLNLLYDLRIYLTNNKKISKTIKIFDN